MVSGSQVLDPYCIGRLGARKIELLSPLLYSIMLYWDIENYEELLEKLKTHEKQLLKAGQVQYIEPYEY